MIIRDLERIETAFESARQHAAATEPPADQARIAQFMTVLASGYLEVACRAVLSVYTERNVVDPRVAGFVGKRLRRTRNPTVGNIADLVRDFDEERAKELTRFASGDVSERIGAMVKGRNRIAHGEPQNVELATVTTQFEAAKELARKLAALFDVEGL